MVCPGEEGKGRSFLFSFLFSSSFFLSLAASLVFFSTSLVNFKFATLESKKYWNWVWKVNLIKTCHLGSNYKASSLKMGSFYLFIYLFIIFFGGGRYFPRLHSTVFMMMASCAPDNHVAFLGVSCCCTLGARGFLREEPWSAISEAVKREKIVSSRRKKTCGTRGYASCNQIITRVNQWRFGTREKSKQLNRCKLIIMFCDVLAWHLTKRYTFRSTKVSKFILIIFVV